MYEVWAIGQIIEESKNQLRFFGHDMEAQVRQGLQISIYSETHFREQDEDWSTDSHTGNDRRICYSSIS